MPACNESWKKCSGFLDCIGPAFAAAGKCTASAAQDVAHAANQEARTMAYNQTLCLWNKYVKGELDAALPQALLGTASYPSGFMFTLDKRVGKDSKKPNWAAFKAYTDKIKNHQLTNADLEEALHECGQQFGNDWAIKLQQSVVTVAVGVIATPAAGAAVGASFVAYKKVMGALAECTGVTGAEAALSVVSAGAAAYGAAAEGGGADVQVAKTIEKATKKGGTVDEIFASLKDLGVDVPEELKDFVACVVDKAGISLVASACWDAVSGDADKAAKALAPYAVQCGVLEIADQLPSGPLQDAVKKAAGIAKLATKEVLKPAPAAPAAKPAAEDAKDEKSCNAANGVWLNKTKQCFNSETFFAASKAAQPSALKQVLDIQSNVMAYADQKQKDEAAKAAHNKQMILIGAGVVAIVLLAR